MLRIVSGDVIFPARTCSYAFFKASSFADLTCAAAGEAGVASGAFMVAGATAGGDFNVGGGCQSPPKHPPIFSGGVAPPSGGGGGAGVIFNRQPWVRALLPVAA